MGQYLQAVVGDPQIWHDTFGSDDPALAERLRNHEDSYIRYLVGNGMDDGRDKDALRRALDEYTSGKISGKVHPDYLGAIAHAVMRSAGEPQLGGDVSVGEALDLDDIWGSAYPIADAHWPIPIGPTEWCLVGVISPDVCKAIVERAESCDVAEDRRDALSEIRRWAERAVALQKPLIVFAS